MRKLRRYPVKLHRGDGMSTFESIAPDCLSNSRVPKKPRLIYPWAYFYHHLKDVPYGHHPQSGS